jgi:hypothetical protein
MTGTDVALAARVVVALVLVASSIGKFTAVPRNLVGLDREELGSYVVVAYAVALSLPLAELVVAACLLFVDAAWPTYVAVVAFVAFTVVLVRKIAARDVRPCNCFGAASSKRDLSPGALVRNGWFLVLAVVATGAAGVYSPSAWLATLLVGVALAGVSYALVVHT